MDSTFLVTVFGLAVIVGGVVAMKALELKEVFIIAYMILSTVAFLGIYGNACLAVYSPYQRNQEIARPH